MGFHFACLLVLANILTVNADCNGDNHGIPCCPHYVNGDMVGGREVRIVFSPNTEVGCQNSCKVQHPTSIGVTQHQDGTSSCYCEFGSPRVGGNARVYKTCLFPPGPKPRQENLADLGYRPDCGAGWYDVQGQGVKNDYCRWVGNCGCRNDRGGDCSWWSCALAGSDEPYSPKGKYTEPGIKSRQKNIADLGYRPNCGADWYDVQGQGVKNDYCRWVGNCGCRGDCSWWSCALAGSNKPYSPKGEYTESDEGTCETSNGACIFPFTYSGNTYNGCTKDDWDRAWCRTRTDGTGTWWGVCPAQCKMHKVSTWEQTKSDDCWHDCGGKGGACPSFCGSNGYCCRKGYDGCPPGAGETSPYKHTCFKEKDKPTCSFANDWYTIIVQNKWKTTEQLKYMDTNSMVDVIISEIHKITAHTKDDLRKRISSTSRGSLGAIANMAANLQKTRGATELKKMDYDSLRSAIIYEMNIYFSMKIEQLLSIDDTHLLASFCLKSVVWYHAKGMALRRHFSAQTVPDEDQCWTLYYPTDKDEGQQILDSRIIKSKPFLAGKGVKLLKSSINKKTRHVTYGGWAEKDLKDYLIRLYLCKSDGVQKIRGKKNKMFYHSDDLSLNYENLMQYSSSHNDIQSLDIPTTTQEPLGKFGVHLAIGEYKKHKAKEAILKVYDNMVKDHCRENDQCIQKLLTWDGAQSNDDCNENNQCSPKLLTFDGTHSRDDCNENDENNQCSQKYLAWDGAPIQQQMQPKLLEHLNQNFELSQWNKKENQGISISVESILDNVKKSAVMFLTIVGPLLPVLAFL